MKKIEQAEAKIQYAEFLLGTDGSFSAGAVKHLLEAATLSVQDLTKLTDEVVSSPRIVQQTLEKFDEKEFKDFASTFTKIWRLSTIDMPDSSTVKDLARKTKKFIDDVKKKAKIGIINKE